jgi:hypothetical protein
MVTLITSPGWALLRIRCLRKIAMAIMAQIRKRLSISFPELPGKSIPNAIPSFSVK